MCSRNTVRYSQICSQNTVRYSQIQSDMNRQQKCISDPYVYYMCFTYIHIYQSICVCMIDICVCMCLYVNGIQVYMHLIQPLSENRYIQIHAYTCRYSFVCIQYRQCICDMDCLISRTYVRAYVSCMCFPYIHIYQSICVLYVLQIHAHMHWQDH